MARISGSGVYSRLKFESGVHRVQRVPETESQGRIHTSACTVAVLPEAEEIDEIEIDPTDLRVDTYRASGRRRPARQQDRLGGAHHPPAHRHRGGVPGRALPAQEPRPGHVAAAGRASRRKRAEARPANRPQNRKLQVGSGDRSERIRTYNFPQNRVTDHRINLTLYKLEEILLGNLDQVIEPLIQEYQAEQLAAMMDA